MPIFEELLEEAHDMGIIVDQTILKRHIALDGLYISIHGHHIILVNRYRPMACQTAALAEELGHHHRSTGIIVEQATVSQRKSEAVGRAWSFEKVLPAQELTGALCSGTCTLWELAELFNLPEGFIHDAIAHYQRKSQLVVSLQCHWCYSA